MLKGKILHFFKGCRNNRTGGVQVCAHNIDLQGWWNVYGRPDWSGQSSWKNYIINVLSQGQKLIQTYTGPDKVSSLDKIEKRSSTNDL